jgi:hypothetical protein
MSNTKGNIQTISHSSISPVIERMDLECDETLDHLKEKGACAYELQTEREQEIFMNGFIEAMEYFRPMLESVR